MFRKTLIALIAFVFAAAALAELPEPADTGVDMVLGDRSGDYYTDITLYYETASGIELTNISRTVYVPAGGSLVETAINELFSPSDETGLAGRLPGDARLSGVSVNGGVVTVDISLNIAGLKSESDLLSLYMAVTNTLCAIDGVEHVLIRVNGRQESVSGLPVGVMETYTTSAAAAMARTQAESASFLGSAQTRIPLERDAVLFFPSTNGQWILPEVRTLSFDSDDYAAELIEALIDGPSGGSAYAPFLSGGVSIMSGQPETSVSSSGERVLDVYLSGTLRDYMLLQDISEWQLTGAITLTMLSFIPELDAVRINIDGDPVERLDVRGVFRNFENGLMHISDYSMFVGATGGLCFSNGEGGLVSVERAMSAERALSPYALMVQLISGPSSVDNGAEPVMPAGITVSDLLGVGVSGGTATVNFTANFYRRCQALNETEEKLLVYSIVNTLCHLPEVSAVRILIEGEQITTLADSIYLMGELLPNPGIIEH